MNKNEFWQGKNIAYKSLTVWSKAFFILAGNFQLQKQAEAPLVPLLN